MTTFARRLLLYFVCGLLLLLGAALLAASIEATRQRNKAHKDVLEAWADLDKLKGKLNTAESKLILCEQSRPQHSDMQRTLTSPRGLSCKVVCTVVGSAASKAGKR